MYQLSLWARHHIWTTRFLIVAIYILLNLTGWLLGEQLAANGIFLSPNHFYIGTALVLAGFFAYPSKKNKKSYTHFYRFQKSCDALLAGGTFVLLVCLAQPQSLPQPWMGLQAHALSVATPATGEPLAQVKNSIFRKAANAAIRWMGIDKAIQKKVAKNWQRLQHEYRQSNNTGKVALVILTILVAVALSFLVVGLACELSCNGSDAAAILVGVLGLGLIIFLSAKIITRINRGPKSPRAPKENETAPATTKTF